MKKKDKHDSYIKIMIHIYDLYTKAVVSKKFLFPSLAAILVYKTFTFLFYDREKILFI